ncbi:MAG TPA: ATP-grasp domain-containing protein [Stellaceae bacterium]|nr:ATP-grasp domain-containing protein [Stellaceae bacterium]
MNGLMVAFAFTLPYHVMRVATAAGIRVRVLGGGAARGLAASRYCRGYQETRSGGDADILLAEIARAVDRCKIDVLLPADDVSTRLLAGLAGRLPARCAPLPEVATFDLLNDKWNFTGFCLSRGIRAPQAWLFETADGPRTALDTGTLALPITAKPTNRSGGVGVLHLRRPADVALLDIVDYRPVLAQRHIGGEAVSITLLCDHGRVRAHVAHQRDAARFRVIADADLLANAVRVAALTGYHGVVNFDAVLSEEDGLAYLVECNPRFWYSIYLVMLAGLNFVELALAPPGSFAEPATLAAGDIRLSLRRALVKPRQARPLDRAFVSYCLSDPVAFSLQRAKVYDDSAVAVPAAQMRQAPTIGGSATV